MVTKHLIFPLLGGLLVAAAGYAGAGVKVVFRADFDPDRARRAEIERAVDALIREAVDILHKETDCRLDLAHDSLKTMVGYIREADGVVPACYMFPDSTLRIIPEYVETVGCTTTGRTERLVSRRSNAGKHSSTATALRSGLIGGLSWKPTAST